MSKTYTIVGVSTQGTSTKVTKFRVANGDLAARVKVLERNGHTDIKLVELPVAMEKMDAIADFKAKNPEYDNIRLPNEKPATTGVKTVTVPKPTSADPAAAVLADTTESVEA